MHRPACALALAFVIAPLLGAQAPTPVTITPGHADVRGDRVPRGQWHVSATMQGPQGAPQGRGYEWSVTPITWQGRPALLSVQWSDAPGGGHDSTIVDARTLAPIAFRAINPMMRDSVEWAGRKVTGVTVHQGNALRLDATLEGPAFDVTSTDLVIAALPFAAGYRARLAMAERDHQTGAMRVEWLEVDVVGTVDAPDGPAWDVRLRRAEGEAMVQVDQRTREARRMSLTNTRGMQVKVERTRTK